MNLLREIQSNVPVCNYRVDTSLGNLNSSIEQFRVNLDPEYQRGYVWQEDQQSKFVGALIENPSSIPVFWFNWVNNHESSELVDGKQRINACLRWLNNEIEAKCPCGVNVWYKDLDEVSLRGLNISVLMKWNFVDLDEQEVMKFYLRLNCGGTVHTDEELEKVRKMIDGQV